MKVDPENFKDRARNNNRVEPVERGPEKSHWTQSVHTDEHFEYEGTKEHEFHVNCNEKKSCELTKKVIHL